VGNNDNRPMKKVASGVTGASPIWRQIILEALKEKPVIGFPVPEGIVSAEVDLVSGYRAHDGFPSRVEYFLKGSEPTGEDPVHTKLKLCRGKDQLATPAQIARGEYEEKEFFVFKEDDPVSADGTNRWQQGIDSWLANQGDSRYHPPTEYCGDTEEIEVTIEEPAHEATLTTNEIKVKGRILATHEIKKIEIFINENLRETIENNRHFEKIFYLQDGPYTVKVKAEDDKGNTGQREAKIGVNLPWDWQPTPSPSPAPTKAPTLTPAPSLTPTPSLPTASPTL
jgi:hypothetical protein